MNKRQIILIVIIIAVGAVLGALILTRDKTVSTDTAHKKQDAAAPSDTAHEQYDNADAPIDRQAHSDIKDTPAGGKKR